jgi:hypothetical protein
MNDLFRDWHVKRYTRETAGGKLVFAMQVYPRQLVKGEWMAGKFPLASGGDWLAVIGVGVDNSGVRLFDEFDVRAVTPFEAVNVAWEWQLSRERDDQDNWLPEEWLTNPFYRMEYCEKRWPKELP